MSKTLLSTGTLLCLAAVICGCGGAASVASSTPVVAAPSVLTVQPDTVVLCGSNSPNIIQEAAIRGSVLYTASYTGGNEFVWSGSQRVTFNTTLRNAALACANLEYGSGQCDSPSGSYEGFIWAYGKGGGTVELPHCVTLAQSKNGTLFFDQEQTAPGQNAPIYVLSVQGQTLKRTPYKTPAGTYLDPLNGASINKSGLALIRPQFYKPADIQKSLAHLPEAVRTGHLPWQLQLPRSSQIAGHGIKETTTSGSGFFLVSTTEDPVELEIPNGAYFMIPMALNDEGISAGYAYYADPVTGDFIDKPYYWDRHGKPHAMQLPQGIEQGIVWDINASGVAVGDFFDPNNPVSGLPYGAMWPTLNSVPEDVDGLLAPGTPYNVFVVQSIGEDCTMMAVCNPAGDFYEPDLDFVGLQPGPTAPSR